LTRLYDLLAAQNGPLLKRMLLTGAITFATVAGQLNLRENGNLNTDTDWAGPPISTASHRLSRDAVRQIFRIQCAKLTLAWGDPTTTGFLTFFTTTRRILSYAATSLSQRNVRCTRGSSFGRVVAHGLVAAHTIDRTRRLCRRRGPRSDLNRLLELAQHAQGH
jgi:hypothetical protein